jgi:hypothetical protein
MKVPLRYLIGVLYENFKLIWDPIIELIKSYANYMKMNEFWSVFGDYLGLLSDRIGIFFTFECFFIKLSFSVLIRFSKKRAQNEQRKVECQLQVRNRKLPISLDFE